MQKQPTDKLQKVSTKIGIDKNTWLIVLIGYKK